MKIELSLLSVLSTAFLVLFCVVGNQVVIDSVEADFSLSSSGLEMIVHPTWVVLVPSQIVSAYGGRAFAFGNVIVIGDHLNGRTYRGHILNHERIHLAQFRALGFLVWPAQFVLPIEPPSDIETDWNDKTQPSRTMWQPPSWWPYKWSFIELSWKI